MPAWAQSRQKTSESSAMSTRFADKTSPLQARGAETGLARGRRLTAAHRLAPVQKPVGIQSPPQTEPAAITGLQERRRRRRAVVPPMYTEARLRMLSRRQNPIDGYVVNLSETGMLVEADALIPVGQPVTVQFRAAGLGKIEHGAWTEFAAAAEVVRHDDLDDFPGGPYRIALRFVQISTMMQAHIARFVATHP